MEFNAKDLSFQERYKLMIGSIVPRPIAWVSSIDSKGNYNLAPFSFFTAVCPEPPLVVFCPNIRSLNKQPKDTLRNIETIPEFVINIVTQNTVEAMNITSTELPPDVDEFSLAGLTPVPSKIVKPPRVAESPIQFECKLHQIVKIGEQAGQGSLVIGEIVYFHIYDSVYVASHKIDPTKVHAVARMGGNLYARTTDLFELVRPPAQIAIEEKRESHT